MGTPTLDELDRYIEEHQANPERIWVIAGPSPLDRAIYLLDQHRTDIFAEDIYVMAWWERNNNEAGSRTQASRSGRRNRSLRRVFPAREDCEGTGGTACKWHPATSGQRPGTTDTGRGGMGSVCGLKCPDRTSISSQQQQLAGAGRCRSVEPPPTATGTCLPGSSAPAHKPFLVDAIRANSSPSPVRVHPPVN